MDANLQAIHFLICFLPHWKHKNMYFIYIYYYYIINIVIIINIIIIIYSGGAMYPQADAL